MMAVMEWRIGAEVLERALASAHDPLRFCMFTGVSLVCVCLCVCACDYV